MSQQFTEQTEPVDPQFQDELSALFHGEPVIYQAQEERLLTTQEALPTTKRSFQDRLLSLEAEMAELKEEYAWMGIDIKRMEKTIDGIRAQMLKHLAHRQKQRRGHLQRT